MDFSYTPEQEAFHEEMHPWLVDRFPPELCIDNPADERVAPNRDFFEETPRLGRPSAPPRDWSGSPGRKKSAGRGASVMDRSFITAEYGRGAGPLAAGIFGGGDVRATIAQWGAKKSQRERFLKRILSSKDIWCGALKRCGST